MINALQQSCSASKMQESPSTLPNANFQRPPFTFQGQVVDQAGIYPDPKRVKATTQIKTPQIVGEVHRFLGMTNQLNKFSPLITEKSKPLRNLLAKKTEWVWGHEQASSFQAVNSLTTVYAVRRILMLPVCDRIRHTAYFYK